MASMEVLRSFAEFQMHQNIGKGIGESLYSDALMNYLHHSITAPGLRWLMKQKEDVQKLFNKRKDEFSIITMSSKRRTMRDTVKDVNALAKQKGYKGKDPFMEDNIFAALTIRSDQLVDQLYKHDYFDNVWNHFGEKVVKGVGETGEEVVTSGYSIVDFLKEFKYKSYRIGDKVIDWGADLKAAREAAKKTGKKPPTQDQAIRAAFKKEGIDLVQLPAGVWNDVKKPFDLLKDSKQLEKFFGKYDKIMQIYRASVTSVWPLYHTRNMIGNYWNGGILGGVSNIRHWITGEKLNRAIWKSLNENSPDLLKKLKVDGKSGEAWLTEMDLMGVMKTPKDAASLHDGGLSVVNQALVGSGRQTKNFIYDPRAWGRERIGVPVPLPGYKDGLYLENSARISHYLGKRRQGFSKMEAAASVRKFFFNYEELSPLEKQWGRRLAFFYTWTRKNTPLVFEHAMHPAVRAWSAAVGQTDEKVEDMPQWLRDAYIFSWKEKDGTWRSLDLGLPPQEPLRLQSLSRLFSQASPVIRGPVELATGVEVFTGRKLINIDRLTGVLDLLPSRVKEQIPGYKKLFTTTGKEYERIDPRINTALRMTPLSRLASTPFAGESAFNLFLGKLRRHPTPAGKTLLSSEQRRMIERGVHAGEMFEIQGIYGAEKGSQYEAFAKYLNQLGARR
jgi:hypothetical protein